MTGSKLAGRLLGDVVGDLVERVPDGELRGDLRDRKAGGLGGQRRRTAHPRVHLDDDDLAVRRGSSANCTLEPPVSTPTRRMQVKAASRISWYSTSVRVWLGATVIESPGVHAHGVEVLDGADDHAVVRVVTHHLEFELLPALDRLLDQDLA